MNYNTGGIFMYKIIFSALALLFISIFTFKMQVRAEEIHFDNDTFILKYSAYSPVNKGYENEYFFKNENKNNWTKMVGLYHYPDVTKPIKFADDESKKIEASETNVFLKMIENKKAAKAAISYLQNGECAGKRYFEYNIYRYEKSAVQGMVALRYAVRYFFDTDADITEIGQKVREINDEYLEKFISSPMPLLVEKNINEN